MSVARVHAAMQHASRRKRVGTKAAIFLAGAVQHMALQVLEAAQTRTLQQGRKRITPTDVSCAIHFDGAAGVAQHMPTTYTERTIRHVGKWIVPKKQRVSQ